MSNNKELKIGVIFSILGIILGSLIQIFYTPFYMKYLGVSDYGINSLVQSLIGYIGMLNLGLGNAMLKYTLKYRIEKKYEAEKSLNGMFLIIFSILMIVSFCIGIILYLKISNLFGNKFSFSELEKTKKVFLIMLFNISFSFPLGIFSTNIASHEKFIFQKGLSLINTVGVPIIGVLLMIKGFGIIALSILTVIFSMIISMLNIRYSLKLGMRIKFKNIEWKILKEVFIYSFYIFLNAIIDRIYWNTDRVIIGKYIGTKAITIYSIASIFSMLYMSLSNAVSGVLFPKINKIIALEENSDKKLSELFIKVGRIQYLLMALISTGFILYGKNFIILWLGKEYLEAYSICLWIMIPLTVPLIQNTGIDILQAKNLHAFRSIVYFFIAIINIFVSILLVKNYGVIGCAIATGISFIIGHIIIMNIYYKNKINIDIYKFWKEILKMSFPILIAFILAFILNLFFINMALEYFVIKIFLYSIIYIILIFFLGINKEEKKIIINLLKFIFKNIKNIFLIKYIYRIGKM